MCLWCSGRNRRVAAGDSSLKFGNKYAREISAPSELLHLIGFGVCIRDWTGTLAGKAARGDAPRGRLHPQSLGEAVAGAICLMSEDEVEDASGAPFALTCGSCAMYVCVVRTSERL